jgi:hypothetical protein
MNEQTSAMTLTPADAEQKSERRSALGTAGFLLLLSLGFTASALIDASEPTETARYANLLIADAPDPDTGGSTAGAAESHEVAASVRHWTWEARSAESKPVGRYDFEELWLGQY